MKLMKIMQSTALAICTMVTGSALAAVPSIPSTNPGSPGGALPGIPNANPATPASNPSSPSSIPGTPIDTISLAFVGYIKGAPTWNNVKSKGAIPIQFTLTKGTENLTDPRLVTSRTVTGVDCNTGSVIAGSSYGFKGTGVRYIKGLKRFAFNWKMPSNAAKGACISLNIQAGAGLGGTSNVFVKLN